MRYLYPALALLLLLACDPSNRGETTMVELKEMPDAFDVGFYNVENLFDIEDDPNTDDQDFLPYGRYGWTEERYEHKLKQMHRVLRNMDAQLLGLAEVENRVVLEDLIALMPEGRWAIAHEVGYDGRGIECALLYDPSLFQLIDTELHSMSGKKDRGILEVALEDTEGLVWRCYVNHWPSRREGVKQTEGKRLRAASSLVQAMSDHSSSERVLVMGDFNDEPEDASLKMLKELHNISQRGEFGIGTCVFKNEWFMYDQILVNPTLNDDKDWEADSFEIMEENWLLYNNRKASDYFPNRTLSGTRYFGGFSDHLPVIAHISR
jgi:endonuclease/exonuclease/phosphatase family metal-dependent hydrolase